MNMIIPLAIGTDLYLSIFGKGVLIFIHRDWDIFTIAPIFI